MCCASVCFAGAKNKSVVSTEGSTPDRPAAASVTRDANVTFPTSTLPAAATARRQKPLLTTDGGMDSRQVEENPQVNDGGSAENSSGGEAPVKEAASKRNTSVQGGNSSGFSAAIRSLPSSSATAEQLRSATSLAGTLVLLLISVVIAGALFVMVICFIHKWKENMGTG